MRALAQDEERVAFWRRHTLSGMVLCEVIPAIIAARTLTTDPSRAGLLLALAAAVAGSAPLLALVPVDRLVRHPRGRLFFDTWEALGIALVITFCVLDEGADSPYVLFLFVLLAHAALAYPPAGVALAGTSILVGYLGMGLGLGGVPADDVLVGALALAVATATCAFASANHQRAYQRTAAYAQQVALLAERDGLTGEFALLLPDTDLSEATGIAERLVSHVRTAAAPYAATVSVGAATVTWGDPVGLHAAADAAVYRAKHSGRNRVCLHPVASDGSRSPHLTPSGR